MNSHFCIYIYLLVDTNERDSPGDSVCGPDSGEQLVIAVVGDLIAIDAEQTRNSTDGHPLCCFELAC